MKKDIRLIVADIDGTLAGQAADPSGYTIETIDLLEEKGYLFGLASGRPVDDIMNKYQIWGSRRQYDFLIGWNGADLFDAKTGIKYRYDLLKKEWIREIIEFMSEFDCAVHMYYGDKYLSSKMTEKAWYSAYKNHREFIVADDISQFYEDDNAGIMFRVKLEDVPSIHEKMKLLEGKEYYGYNSQADLIEFSNIHCNKANALIRYCQMHDIDIGECLAFGDTTNDNEMIRITSGVCMSNGSDDTRAVAGRITDRPCSEDGFADYIRKNVL